MKRIMFALAATVLGTASAAALPTVKADTLGAAASLADPVAYRYHRNCGWRGGRWVVDLGAGKLVVCRPNRPGRSYAWTREGNREGWYDRRRRSWHYNNW